jgi:hypothetical protein
LDRRRSSPEALIDRRTKLQEPEEAALEFPRQSYLSREVSSRGSQLSSLSNLGNFLIRTQKRGSGRMGD